MAKKLKTFNQVLKKASKSPIFRKEYKKEVERLKKTKIDLRLQHHFICNDCSKKEVIKVIFYNSDDNVCSYCGSKETSHLFQEKLKAEI